MNNLSKDLILSLRDENILAESINSIGKRVRKKSGKPFKSGLKINTVSNILENYPKFNIKGPVFVFKEDDSVVMCRLCEIVEEESPLEINNK